MRVLAERIKASVCSLGVVGGVVIGSMGLIAGVAGTGCTAKASVQRSTPVANLKIYHGVLIRAGANSLVRGQAIELAQRTAAHLEKQCQFTAVYTGQPNSQPNGETDLIVDLNVVGSSRGGNGLIQNPNKAIVDVAMALSDSRTDEILGSASIRGESSSVAISGQGSPETSAINAVANQIAKILANSGCTGPREVASIPEPPPVEVKPVDTGVTPEQVAEAEALSGAGKEAFRGGDVATAKAKFEAAIALNADPRYLMNLCLANEALSQYDEALAACQKVIDAKPEQRLADKAMERIGLINDLKSE